MMLETNPLLPVFFSPQYYQTSSAFLSSLLLLLRRT